MAFFWPLFHKIQLCGVYSLKWSYGQILQSPLWSFAASFGFFVASIINALLYWWAALSWQLCCGAIFFPFLNKVFNGAPWDVQSFGYFL
jgi:hypothetical protein